MEYPRHFVLSRLCIAALLLLSTSLRAVESIPADDFARREDIDRVRISGDGKCIAYLRNVNDVPTLFVGPIDNPGSIVKVDLHKGKLLGGGPEWVYSFWWVNNHRIVFATCDSNGERFTGMYGINPDGSRLEALAGVNRSKGYSLAGWPLDNANSMLHLPEDNGNDILILDRSNRISEGGLYPDVVKMDTLDGAYDLVVSNPGKVIRWAVDHNGVVRVGVEEASGSHYRLIYRDNEHSAWRKLPVPTRDDRDIFPLGFDAANENIYVAALSPTDHYALYALDPKDGKLAGPILSDSSFDLYANVVDPKRITGRQIPPLFFSGQTHEFEGMNYLADASRTLWVNTNLLACQQLIDNALPKTANNIVSISADHSRIIVYSISDRDPGTYYLFEPKNPDRKTLRAIGKSEDWINPNKMAAVHPIHYTARDGLSIPAYLTLPVGQAPKNLPLIVVPNCSLADRADWEFDPFIQFFANRGYAVLLINYRGSTGYGDALHQAGVGQIGGKIQDDIEDGTQWAISHGITTQGQIAVVGAGYGGYSALFALEHNPNLYCCGISISGITNWKDFIHTSDNKEYASARAYWIKQLGGSPSDDEHLNVISPITFADKIVAPVLLIHGKDNEQVPPGQIREIISKARSSGHEPEALFISDEAEYIFATPDRVAMYRGIDSFLAKHLPVKPAASN